MDYICKGREGMKWQEILCGQKESISVLESSEKGCSSVFWGLSREFSFTVYLYDHLIELSSFYHERSPLS